MRVFNVSADHRGVFKKRRAAFSNSEKVPLLFSNACTALDLLLVMMVANRVFWQHVAQLFLECP